MKNKKAAKDLAFYLGLRYPVTIHADPEGGVVAEIEELPGCMTQAETLDDAFTAIEDARQAWIEAAYEDEQDIPLPRDLEEYSGKFVVRIPRSLHRNLAQAAKREGVSLNQYVTDLLARGLQGDTMRAQLSVMLLSTGMMALYSGVVFGDEGKPMLPYEIDRLRHKELVR